MTRSVVYGNIEYQVTVDDAGRATKVALDGNDVTLKLNVVTRRRLALRLLAAEMQKDMDALRS